jgi:hypothetical protein
MGKEAIEELEPVEAGPSPKDIWDEIWARVKGDTWTDPDPMDKPPMTPDRPSEE